MATPKQPRRPIRRVAAATTVAPATRGSLALSDPVIASNPYASGANIYPNASSPNAQGVISPNPPVDTVSKSEPPLKNYGATGTSFFGGIIQSDEYNPEFGWRDAVIKYEQMSRNEAQIFAIKQLVEQPMLAANWKIEPASDSAIDQEIASFVQSCLFDDMCYTTSDGTEVYQSWQETLRQILMYKWYGFMLLEKCFRIDDGWVKWSRWLPLLPRTVWRWYVGEDNELESVEQWAYKQWTYQYNRIPRGKLLHFANRMEGQNYQGVSVLRSAFKNWWYKQQFEKIAAVEIERNAIIPPVMTMGEHPSQDEVNNAFATVRNLRANEQMGVVIGHDMKLEYPRMTERGAAQIMPLIEYHDNMIARNILGQFINLGSHEVGSYALAQTQYTNFLNTLQSDCAYVCDIINHQAIRQLVDYNYDGVAVYPKLTCSRLVAQDITTLSNALQYLGAYVPPSPEVNDAIADALGLPKPPASMVEATNPGAPTTPERPDNGRASDHTTDEGGDAPGHVSGTGGGRDGTADYQDTYDNGGAGDGVGMSESADAALREFRLLRESLDAFNAQVSADDAVERGVIHLAVGDGYNPYRDHGKFAPGPHAERPHEGSGRGHGEGASGGAGGSSKGEHEGSSHSSKGEHAPKASSTRSRGSGSKAKAEAKESKSRRVTKRELEDAAAHEHDTAVRQRHAEVEHSKAHEGLKAAGETLNHAAEGRRAALDARDKLLDNKGRPRRGVSRAQLEQAQQAVRAADEHLNAAMTAHALAGGRVKAATDVLNASRISAQHAANVHETLRGIHEQQQATTHATHAAKSSTRSSSSTRGKASGGKSAEEQHAEKVTAARARRDEAEKAFNNAHGHAVQPAHDELVASNKSLARIEGRKLAPGEAQYTRKDWQEQQAREAEHRARLDAVKARDKAAKSGSTKTTPAAKGERTLEQHTHDELKAMAKEQGVKAGKTKAETIKNLRAKGEGAPKAKNAYEARQQREAELEHNPAYVQARTEAHEGWLRARASGRSEDLARAVEASGRMGALVQQHVHQDEGEARHVLEISQRHAAAIRGRMALKSSAPSTPAFGRLDEHIEPEGSRHLKAETTSASKPRRRKAKAKA